MKRPGWVVGGRKAYETVRVGGGVEVTIIDPEIVERADRGARRHDQTPQLGTGWPDPDCQTLHAWTASCWRKGLQPILRKAVVQLSK